MTPTACFSKAALQAGVPPRFLYWQGHSRRRYLFTRTSMDELSGFDEGVVIAVRGGEIVWTGEVGEIASSGAARTEGEAAVYVHLLAADGAERRAVVEEFRPRWSGPQCLAA